MSVMPTGGVSAMLKPRKPSVPRAQLLRERRDGRDPREESCLVEWRRALEAIAANLDF
jgi:hypothetical protein